MTSYEDIGELTQEWFGQCLTAEDVARLYAHIRIELENQLKCCMKILTGEG